MRRLRLYAAGSNSHGQLGIDSLEDAHSFTRCVFVDSPSIESSSSDVHIKVTAGANHTLLLVRIGEESYLYGAGSTRQGQLGRSDDRLAPAFGKLDLLEPGANLIDIAAGWESSFLLLGKQIIRLGAVAAVGLHQSCAQTSKLPLDAEDSLSSIAAGPSHCVVLTAQGKLYGSGTSRHGQLGAARSLNEAAFERLDLGSTAPALAVAVGHQHTAVVLGKGGDQEASQVRLTSLGSNRKGQLGAQDPKTRASTVQIAEAVSPRVRIHSTWNTTFFRNADTLLSFGSNAHGQLGRDSSNQEDGTRDNVQLPSSYRIEQIAAGSEHVLALLVSSCGQREVWGWGWNEHGNLGLEDGSLANVMLPKRIWVAGSDEQIRSVHAGNGTSWIATMAQA